LIKIPATRFGPIVGPSSRLIFEQMECTTSQLFKDQPEDGPTIGPKRVAGILIKYSLIKYKVVYDCIIE